MLIKDTQDWVARARALVPMVEAAAGRTEKERKIPADVLSAMHACGLFHMLLPVSLPMSKGVPPVAMSATRRGASVMRSPSSFALRMRDGMLPHTTASTR